MSPLSNPLLFFAILASVFAQLAMIYVPALRWVFQTEPLSAEEWVRVFVLSLTVIVAVEIDKAVRRRRKHA
jgi:Ca2+-transporting ATPase